MCCVYSLHCVRTLKSLATVRVQGFFEVLHLCVKFKLCCTVYCVEHNKHIRQMHYLPASQEAIETDVTSV